MKTLRKPGILLLISVAFLFGSFTTAGAENLVEKAKGLEKFYKDSDLWAMKAIALVSLSDVKHPQAVRSMKPAFKEGEMREKLYAVESLKKLPENVLKCGADKEFMELIIEGELDASNSYYKESIVSSVESVTGKTFGSADEVRDWWNSNKEKYTSKEWTGGVGGQDEKGSPDTAAMIGKLIDLKQHGLDMAIVMDATGSMKSAIDAAKKGLNDLSKFVQAITPKFRLAVVYYRDNADIQQKLTPNIGLVRDELDDLGAAGGGDKPEAVAKGLKTAYKKLSWRKKAGKVGIVVGDAPPHNRGKCKDLAKKARDISGKNDGSDGPETGSKEKEEIPPFITSCLATPAGGGFSKKTVNAFKEIADEGGGKFAKLDERKEIVKQILKLSFSGDWDDQIDKFVDWTYKFKEKGLW